jgi:tetratricopeptide (TPR) repeat protein
MRNLFLFIFLTFLTGNPILAILIIVVLYLFLDYQFIGISRRSLQGLRRSSQIRALQRTLTLNPHDAKSRSLLGRLLVESRRYPEAVRELRMAMERMSDSEETGCDLGVGLIWTGNEEEGGALVESAMEKQPRLRYGEPYLRWGHYLLRHGNPGKALEVLGKFHEIHTSSVEGHYLQGEAHRMLGHPEEAASAYHRAILMFRQSPAYKRRLERRWAWLSRIRLIGIQSPRKGEQP